MNAIIPDTETDRISALSWTSCPASPVAFNSVRPIMRASTSLNAQLGLNPLNPSYQPQHKCFKQCQHAQNAQSVQNKVHARLVRSRDVRDVKIHAQGNFGTQIIGGGLSAGNEIFVAGGHLSSKSQLGKWLCTYEIHLTSNWHQSFQPPDYILEMGLDMGI